MTNTSTTHIVSDCIVKTDPKKDTIILEPVAHHITCETTGKILGYRDISEKGSNSMEKFNVQQTWPSFPGL